MSYTAVMKTAISIPDDVFEKAEYFAKKHGMSRSQLYVIALQRFISSPKQALLDQLNQVYSDEPNLGRDPATERAALIDLPRDEW